MKILALSDVESRYYYEYYAPGRLDGLDLILCCGDLRREYLEFLTTMARCPVLYVRGNHDDALLRRPPEGCVCVEDMVCVEGGLRVAGLGGAHRYREGCENLYTEREMSRRVRSLRRGLRRAGGCDIFISHAPARGVNDLDTPAHMGFACFLGLLDRWQPKYFIHGHVHRNYGMNIPRRTQYGTTTVINAFEHYVFEF